MIENVMTLVFGALLCVLGAINMTGNVSSLHSYHRHRVKEEDKKPFGRLVGLGTALVGVSILTNGILSMISPSKYEIVGLVILIAGIVSGIALNIIAMIKYNKGIF